MLSVTPQLDLGTVRQGIRRRYRFMQIDVVPPTEVLRYFYAAHPEFVIGDDGIVESTRPLDYRELLGDVEQVFVEVLRASPTGLLERSELEEAVTARGINLNTFSVFTSYSPILDHPATNVWCLRGLTIDPSQVHALLTAAARPRLKRTLDYGLDPDGMLRLTASLASVASPVVYVPAAISHYVAGRRFRASTREGTASGLVAVDESGASWGYGPFLRRRGAEPGDSLTARFDLVSESVLLTLDDDANSVDDS